MKNCWKNYCFTKKEMRELINYLNFAIEHNMAVDKSAFIELVKEMEQENEI